MPHPAFSAASSVTWRRRAVSNGYWLVVGTVIGSHAFFAEYAIRSDEREEVFERILIGRVRQFVGKRLHGEGVIDVGDGTQPSDTHVIFGGTVFNAQVGDIERNVAEAEAEFAFAAIGAVEREG